MLTYAEVQALVETRVAASTTFPGTQFACFTGTKVQILTQKALLGAVNTITVTIMSNVLITPRLKMLVTVMGLQVC